MESARKTEVKRRSTAADRRGDSLPQLDAIHLAGGLQSILNSVEGRDFTLDIQQDAGLRELGSAIMSGTRSGYLEMATSTGKTAIESLVAEAAVKAGQRVLMLAPKLSIARQLVGVNQENTTGLARFTDLLNTTTVGRHYGTSRGKSTDQVVVSTYQSFLNDAKHDTRKLGEFDVIIADECHRSLGAQTAEAMRTHSPNALRFGFSATPDYAEDRQADEIFSEKIFEFSLIDAVESGRTAPVRTLLYETDAEIDLLDTRSEYTERELAPLIDNPERNGTAFQLASAFVAEGRQGIIACIPGDRNNHARLMAQLLREHADIATAEVGAHLTDEENALRLAAFHQGLVKVLTFTRSLEEGWDSDKASFCINMAPTSSPVRTKQLLGRVLRKNADDKESVYVDFVDAVANGSKEQYTAMHALELATIDTRRVLGRSQSGGGDWKKDYSATVLGALDDELVARITRSNGRSLSDIMTARRRGGAQFNPVVMQWERTLSREGMPAELPEDSARYMNPGVISGLKTTAKELRAEFGEMPTDEEVIDAAIRSGRLTSVAATALKAFGTRIDDPVESLEEIIMHNEDFSQPERIAYQAMAVHSLEQVLIERLSEREGGVLVMRYGLDEDGYERTLDEVSDRFGVSRERIRGIEKKALEKLATPARLRAMNTYRTDSIDEPLARQLTQADLDRIYPRTPQQYAAYVTKRRYAQLEPDAKPADLFALGTLYERIEQFADLPKSNRSLTDFTEFFKPYGDAFGISRQRFHDTTSSSYYQQLDASRRTFDQFSMERAQMLRDRFDALTGRMNTLDSRYATRPTPDNRDSHTLLSRERSEVGAALNVLLQLRTFYADFVNDRPFRIPMTNSSSAA